MKYTLIEPPYDRYSDSALEVWEAHLQRLEAMHEADPDDEGVKSSLKMAECTVAAMRRDRADAEQGQTG